MLHEMPRKRNSLDYVIKFYQVLFYFTAVSIYPAEEGTWKNYLAHIYAGAYNITVLIGVLAFWQYRLDEDSNFVQLIVDIINCTGSVLFISYYVYINLKKRNALLNLDGKLETIYNNVCTNGNDKKYRYIYFLCSTAIFYWTVTFIFHYRYGPLDAISRILHKYSLFISHVIIIKIMMYLIKIAKILQYINILFDDMELRSVVNEIKPFTYRGLIVKDTFKRYETYFDRVCECINEINKNYGYTLLLYVIFVVFKTTLDSIRIFMIIEVNNMERLSFTVTRTAASIVTMASFVFMCGEIKKNIKYRQHKNAEIMTHCKTNEMMEAIERFHYKISRLDLNITARGYFTFNSMLLWSILQGIITNLTVVLQVPFPKDLN